MAKEELLEFDGTVTEVLPDGNFRVKLDNEHEVLAYTAGKMRKFRIRTGVGDRVIVEMSPYDLSAGASASATRATRRHRRRSNAGRISAAVKRQSQVDCPPAGATAGGPYATALDRSAPNNFPEQQIGRDHQRGADQRRDQAVDQDAHAGRWRRHPAAR